MPSFLDTYRRDARPGISSFRLGSEPPEDETPFERWQRENRERMEAAGALPTEEMVPMRIAGAGVGAAGVGRDIAAGSLGIASNLTGFYNLPFRGLEPFFGRSPVGQAQDWLQEQSVGLQETPDPSWMPGEGAPRGAYSEALIESSLAAGNTPVEAAMADTARATLGLADPFDLTPAGAAGTLGTFLQRFLRRGADEAAPAAGRLARDAGEGLVDEFSTWRGLPEPERSTPLEAMEHAGSGASPEAASRMQGGTRFYEVSPGGEVTPIIGQDAVDRPARRGRAKVRVSPNGEIVVEDGTLTDAGRRALEGARAEAPPASLADEPDTELDLDAGADEDFLRSMGVELPSGRAQSLSDASAPPARPPEPPGASDALEGRLPFQYNARERFGLDDDAAEAWTEMIEKDLPAFQAQRRADGPSNQEVMDSIESIAQANGMTVRKFLRTEPGTTFNREELMFLDSAIQRRTQDIGDLSRRLEEARAGNLGDVDRLQLELAQSIYEQNSLLKVSVGASSETGRALQSRQQFVRALKKCFGGG